MELKRFSSLILKEWHDSITEIFIEACRRMHM